jgi:NAD(P)-dependent dehydrogenase (short-subunit alcohol dehydrogenase family)
MTLSLTGLEGKVALITGAGRMRSIGRGIAQSLAQAGCDIVVTGSGRDPQHYPDDEKEAGWRDIESVAEEVRAMGRRALPLVSDVSDLEAVQKLADEVIAEMGRIDFVINNAGASRAGDRAPVVDVSAEVWRNVINVNLNGTFYMSQEQWAGVIDAYIPLKRAGDPADIGNMVAYLCSDQGSWINGQLYSVDGGHAAGR